MLGALVLIAIVISSIAQIKIVTIIANIISIDKLIGYSESDYVMNPLLQIFEIFFVTYFVFMTHWLAKKSQNNRIETIYKINSVGMFLSLLVIIYSLSFERLIRPFLLLDYAVFTGNQYALNRKNKMILYVSLVIVLLLRISFTLGYTTGMFMNCDLFAF